MAGVSPRLLCSRLQAWLGSSARDAAGYIGGGAWFVLLFLPAIGLRKMTELATQGDYKSAANLGAALQILHPSADVARAGPLISASGI